MDKAQALQTFWGSFGIPAYDENTVPDNAELPYITYRFGSAAFDEPIGLEASVWYRSTGWQEITQAADMISSFIGLGGVRISYQGGSVWIKRGAPFSQRMGDPTPNIRRIILQCEAEFMSED